MKLGDTILYIESVAETIAFYEIAFGLERGMVTANNEYGELQTGETKMAFAANSFATSLIGVPFDSAAPDRAAPLLELALVSETVEADMHRLLRTVPWWSNIQKNGPLGSLSATFATTTVS